MCGVLICKIEINFNHYLVVRNRNLWPAFFGFTAYLQVSNKVSRVCYRLYEIPNKIP